MNRPALVLAFLLLSAAASHADNEPAPSKPLGNAPASSNGASESRPIARPPEGPEPSTALNAAAAAETEGKKGTGGVFLPSEEISEDFAVSFPVDI